MDEIGDIEQLERDQADWSDEFGAGLLVMNGRLLDALYGLIDRLSLKGRATTAAEVTANMTTVTLFRADLTTLLQRLGFADSLNVLLTHMGQSADRLNGYYGRIVTDFNPLAYSSFVEGLTAQTRTLLLANLDTTYGAVIGDALSWSVLTKSTAAELRTTLRLALSETGLPARNLGGVASDALYTFSRGYGQAVAEGLNLRHYYYMGNQITNTRDFCAARLGKAFTQVEVEKWPDLTWAGKIPGTTSQSIYWYCGGYRCRHRLLPISKNAFSILTNNNQ